MSGERDLSIGIGSGLIKALLPLVQAGMRFHTVAVYNPGVFPEGKFGIADGGGGPDNATRGKEYAVGDEYDLRPFDGVWKHTHKKNALQTTIPIERVDL